MSNKKKKQKKKKNYFLLLIVGLLVILAGYFVTQKSTTQPLPRHYTTGGVESCRHNPAFIAKVGLKEPVLIDFRQKEVSGFQILEAQGAHKVLRMPTWDDAGHLGPYTLDEKGNIYTAAVPYVSLEENPPSEQNKIHIVNTNDGKMKEFFEFKDGIPDNNNPFGVMGLAYDCETQSLYATSIAGSTFKKSKGVLYKINLKTKKVESKVTGFDAMGIGIYKTSSGKKMYMGATRTPEIFSIGLDEKGNFIGQPAFEFSLAALEGGSYDNAHRIRFKKNEMEIKAIEFSYSLIAASDPLRNIYRFSYDADTDKWNFISVEQQQQ